MRKFTLLLKNKLINKLRKEKKKGDDNEWFFRICVKLQATGTLLTNPVITRTKF